MLPKSTKPDDRWRVYGSLYCTWSECGSVACVDQLTQLLWLAYVYTINKWAHTRTCTHPIILWAICMRMNGDEAASRDWTTINWVSLFYTILTIHTINMECCTRFFWRVRRRPVWHCIGKKCFSFAFAVPVLLSINMPWLAVSSQRSQSVSWQTNSQRLLNGRLRGFTNCT